MYFFTNYLDEKAFYKDLVDYDLRSDENIALMRTNNASEGYNNRLRTLVKFIHPSVGYVITVLINEESAYKDLTLKITTRKQGFVKRDTPSHFDITTKMPIFELFYWLTDFIKKKKKDRILSEVDIEDFSRIANLEDVKIIIENIESEIFEEDLMITKNLRKSTDFW